MRRPALPTILFAILAFAAALFRLTAYRNPTSVVSFPDSGCFTGTAKLSLFSPGFYLGIRPCFVPLFYKLCGNSETAIVMGQILFAMLTRTLLAFAVFRVLGRSLAGCAGAALVLAFGYAHRAAAWDQIIMSESISLSLQCLLLALLLLTAHSMADPELRARPELKLCVALTVVTGVAFGFARDSNIYTVQLMLPLGAFATWRLFRSRGPWKTMAGATVALLVAAAVQNSTMNASKRWQYPFFNLLGQRILREKPLLDYFRSAGLPVTPELMKHAGKWASDDNYAIYGAPGVFPWVEQHAVSTYKAFLLSNPSYTLRPAWKGLDGPLRQSVRDKTGGLESSQPAWFAPVGSLLHPDGSGMVKMTLLLFAALGLMAAIRRDRTALALTVIAGWMILTSFVQVLINYHGDAMEFNRHILPAVFGFRLALWTTLALALDQIMKLMAAPPEGALRAKGRGRRVRVKAARSVSNA